MASINDNIHEYVLVNKQQRQKSGLFSQKSLLYSAQAEGHVWELQPLFEVALASLSFS